MEKLFIFHLYSRRTDGGVFPVIITLISYKWNQVSLNLFFSDSIE